MVARLIPGHHLIWLLLMAVTATSMVAILILEPHSIGLPIMDVTVTTMHGHQINARPSLPVPSSNSCHCDDRGHQNNASPSYKCNKSIPTIYCILFDKTNWWSKFYWGPYGNYSIFAVTTPYYREKSQRYLLKEVFKGFPWAEPGWHLYSQPPGQPWADLPD